MKSDTKTWKPKMWDTALCGRPYSDLFDVCLVFYGLWWIVVSLTIIPHLLFCEARVAQWVRSLNLATHTSLSPIRHGFAPGFLNYKKGCTWLAAASDKVYQLLAHGQWFSPASSIIKNWSPWYSWSIVESGVKTQKINQIKSIVLNLIVDITYKREKNRCYWLKLIKEHFIQTISLKL